MEKAAKKKKIRATFSAKILRKKKIVNYCFRVINRWKIFVFCQFFRRKKMSFWVPNTYINILVIYSYDLCELARLYIWDENDCEMNPFHVATRYDFTRGVDHICCFISPFILSCSHTVSDPTRHYFLVE